MDFDKLPSKPAVPSLTRAIAEIDSWIAQNKYEHIKDSSGLEWQCNIQAFNHAYRPSPDHEMLWELTITIETKASVHSFIATGTLSENKDDRLISLVGDDLIQIKMRPYKYFAKTEEELRQIMIEVLPTIREKFKNANLTDLKRSLIGRWIDQKGMFATH